MEKNLTYFYHAFLKSRKASGCAPGTVYNYEVTLKLFLRFCLEKKMSDPAEIPLTVIEDYSISLLDRLAAGSVHSYIRNLRIFFKFISESVALQFSPSEIRVPKSPKKQVRIYSDDDIKRILNAIKAESQWLTLRNRAIVALMLDSGLRQVEVVRLKWSDIDFARSVILVHGKGNKDRFVPLGHFVATLLQVYKDASPYQSQAVFVGRRGEDITGNSIRLFLYRLQQELPFEISSHKLRHNFATNFCVDNLKNSGQTNVYDLSILMGHESIETTKRYEHFAHELVAAETHKSHLDSSMK